MKLQNIYHKIRLHSHDVKYGSGSGQQSVTGTEVKEDVNSHWAIKGKPNQPFVCLRPKFPVQVYPPTLHKHFHRNIYFSIPAPAFITHAFYAVYLLHFGLLGYIGFCGRVV